MAGKKILVTGSAGFIGFHLIRRLTSHGHEVVGLDNYNSYYQPAVKEARGAVLASIPGFRECRADLEDIDTVGKMFSESKFDAVCHLGAQAGVRYSMVNPSAYEKSNLMGFLNILELVRKHGIPRLVYASSSSVYGGNVKIPFSESDSVDTPISLYAATKKANELMAHCYSHLYKFQTVGLRFFTVYGPWGRPDMAMWIFSEAVANGGTINVNNHGDMKRDFTYVDDIAAGVESALSAGNLGLYEIFNLGNHRSEPLLKMIGLLEKEFGVEARKRMMPMQPGDVPETYADIEKARKLLGFEPKTSIEEGIPNFVRWYQEHSELTHLVRDTRGKFCG